MAILGELQMRSGTINVKGKVGYASQQAWIYNSSLRHNILFGKEYEEDRYNQVIKACALERVSISRNKHTKKIREQSCTTI
jgi:ABC-type multidrug transport system fused ATPase/permease subunit